MKAFFNSMAIRVLLITIAIAVTHLLLTRIAIKANEWPALVIVPNKEFSNLVGLREALKTTFHQDKENGDQQSPKEKATPSPQEPMDCDSAASYLDFAVIDARKLEGSYLIMIARLGAGETSRRLNRQRLSVVEEYVLRRGHDLKYVLAEGSRVKGLGRIELYVGGRLSRIMPFKKNATGYCFPNREGF